jgi:hypothetical protein
LGFTSRIRLFPRSAISRSPGSGPENIDGVAAAGLDGVGLPMLICSTVRVGPAPDVPPITTIRPGTPASDSGVGSVAAWCTLPSAVTASTESTAAPFRPMPPTTYMTPPSTPAEACIRPCGSVPIRVTLPVDGAKR